MLLQKIIWSPTEHWRFPPAAHETVKTLMMIYNRSEVIKSKFPLQLWMGKVIASVNKLNHMNLMKFMCQICRLDSQVENIF